MKVMFIRLNRRCCFGRKFWRRCLWIVILDPTTSCTSNQEQTVSDDITATNHVPCENSLVSDLVTNSVVGNVTANGYCPCCRYHSSNNNISSNSINSFVPHQPFVMTPNTAIASSHQQSYYSSYAHFLQHRRYHVSQCAMSYLMLSAVCKDLFANSNKKLKSC